MRIVRISGAVLLLSGLALAQVQGKPYLVQYSCQQSLARAVYQTVTQWCADISYVRSLGKNIDDYVKYLSKLKAPSWDAQRAKGIRSFVAGLYANGQLYEGYLFEVLEESDSLIKARANRPYALYFKDNLTLHGVKIEEYERCRMIYNQQIAAYLGFSYSEKAEGGWIVITVTTKK